MVLGRANLRPLTIESLESRRLMTARIEVGDHVLVPNLGGQRIAITVQDAETITGVNLRAQLGDGSGPQREPTFSGVDLSDSLFQFRQTAMFGGPVAAQP